jgi:hypothetical protein
MGEGNVFFRNPQWKDVGWRNGDVRVPFLDILTGTRAGIGSMSNGELQLRREHSRKKDSRGGEPFGDLNSCYLRRWKDMVASVRMKSGQGG